jgi:hypothetical protein
MEIKNMVPDSKNFKSAFSKLQKTRSPLRKQDGKSKTTSGVTDNELKTAMFFKLISGAMKNYHLKYQVSTGIMFSREVNLS